MTSTTTSKKDALGRAEFIVSADEETLDVVLDRQGFRRLVQTLEQLAERGERQDFGISGRQGKGRNGAASRKSLVLTKLTFHIDDKPTR